MELVSKEEAESPAPCLTSVITSGGEAVAWINTDSGTCLVC
ncbi:similar to RIKEN cDNA 5730457F11, isoform CRA_b, partial [Rattus norvegicus]